jgi:hypothetical protein
MPQRQPGPADFLLDTVVLRVNAKHRATVYDPALLIFVRTVNPNSLLQRIATDGPSIASSVIIHNDLTSEPVRNPDPQVRPRSDPSTSQAPLLAMTSLRYPHADSVANIAALPIRSEAAGAGVHIELIVTTDKASRTSSLILITEHGPWPRAM